MVKKNMRHVLKSGLVSISVGAALLATASYGTLKTAKVFMYVHGVNHAKVYLEKAPSQAPQGDICINANDLNVSRIEDNSNLQIALLDGQACHSTNARNIAYLYGDWHNYNVYDDDFSSTKPIASCSLSILSLMYAPKGWIPPSYYDFSCDTFQPGYDVTVYKNWSIDSNILSISSKVYVRKWDPNLK